MCKFSKNKKLTDTRHNENLPKRMSNVSMFGERGSHFPLAFRSLTSQALTLHNKSDFSLSRIKIKSTMKQWLITLSLTLIPIHHCQPFFLLSLSSPKMQSITPRLSVNNHCCRRAVRQKAPDKLYTLQQNPKKKKQNKKKNRVKKEYYMKNTYH